MRPGTLASTGPWKTEQRTAILIQVCETHIIDFLYAPHLEASYQLCRQPGLCSRFHILSTCESIEFIALSNGALWLKVVICGLLRFLILIVGIWASIISYPNRDCSSSDHWIVLSAQSRELVRKPYRFLYHRRADYSSEIKLRNWWVCLAAFHFNKIVD